MTTAYEQNNQQAMFHALTVRSFNLEHKENDFAARRPMISLMV